MRPWFGQRHLWFRKTATGSGQRLRITVTNRGGKGVKTLSVTEKTGSLISILNVTDEDDLMIVNRSGITIEPVSKNCESWAEPHRVKLISLRGDDSASVCRVPKGMTKKSWLKERSRPILKARRKRR